MRKTSTDILPQIAEQFRIQGDFVSGKPYGNGHINDTFLVQAGEQTNSYYILQRINNQVFKDPPSLMENIERVSSHLSRKMSKLGKNPERNALNLVKTKHNNSYVEHDFGYWRMYYFVKDAVGFERCKSEQMAYECGKAFGEFQNLLTDIADGESLHETIPDFHNVIKRNQSFEDILSKDPIGRAKNVQAEIEAIRSRAEEMAKIEKARIDGELPLRITHNDTKLNNVLLDRRTEDAVCVIDLDTVMPGVSLYDFGDGIRTISNSSLEDEEELDKVWFNLSYFRGFSRGYLEEARGFLSDKEREFLPLAGRLFPYLMLLRFLTDYLDGDNYFKTSKPEHNLIRARTQLKLLESMEEQADDIRKTLESLQFERRRS